MILSGGDFSGYLLDGNQIIFEGTVFDIVPTQNQNEFYVDYDGNKHFYRIDLTAVIYIGANIY